MNSQGRTSYRVNSHALLLIKSLRSRQILLSWMVFASVAVVTNPHLLSAVLASIVIFISMYGIVCIQNDLSDRDTDIANKRSDIALTDASLTEQSLLRTGVALIALVVIAALIVNFKLLIFVSVFLFLGYLYSGRADLKSKGVWATFTLGLCYGFIPWLMAGVLTNWFSLSYLLLCGFASFLFTSGIITLKDYRDEIGDRRTNKNTLLVQKGASATIRYMIILTSFAYLALIMIAMLNHVSLLILLGLGLMITNYLLLSDSTIKISPKTRRFNGITARKFFFLYAVLTYTTLL